MNLKYLVISPFAVFLISLLLSASIVQARTRILTETRRFAIENALTQNQLRHSPEYNAMILVILRTLDRLEKTDLEEAVNKIVYGQNVTTDDVTMWGWPIKWGITYIIDPGVIHTCLKALKLAGALAQVNKEALIDMALSRYNKSDGAFHEPIVEVEWADGRTENHTIGGLYLDFYAISDLAYAESNIVSTFVWVSILRHLNALDRINTTRTLEWILSCKAENGAFKPFPKSRAEHLPPWASLLSNPFYVDRHGTGIAYTYAAVSTVKILGHLGDSDVINREKIKEYVLSSQEVGTRDKTCFKAHPDDERWTVGVMRQYTYYAIKTLEYIDMLEESKPAIAKVVKYILEEQQNLRYEDSWPLPNGPRFWENTWGHAYGLFGGTFLPVHTTYYAVLTLNSTKKLHFLNQITPAASKAWYNLIIFSIIIGGVSSMGILVYEGLRVYKRKHDTLEGQLQTDLARNQKDSLFCDSK